MHPALHRLLFWRNPTRTLARFAQTEAFGARDLARAAEVVEDPWIRRQLLLHAQDEVRHAALLGEGAAAPARTELGAAVAGESAAGSSVEAGEMGTVAFLAFVHVAEQRAVEEFGHHQASLGGDVFQRILKDEERHVAWTGQALKRLSADGQGAAVRAALRRTHLRRWLEVWTRLAGRVSRVTSGVLLGLVWIVVLPVFLLGRGVWRRGWVPAVLPDLARQF